MAEHDLRSDRDLWAGLVGRVWDSWPDVPEREKRQLRRRHPYLVAALDACCDATAEHLASIIEALAKVKK